MFMLGAYLISKYADKPYTGFASERLFGPMNMSTTTFRPDTARKTGLLTQTWTKFGRRVPFGFPEDVVELVAGPGGIISSAADLVCQQSHPVREVLLKALCRRRSGWPSS